MQVIVNAISKFGILDANSEKWLNWEEGNPHKFVFEKGKAYEVETDKKMGRDKKYRTVIVKATKIELAGDKKAEAPVAKAEPKPEPKVEPKKEAPKAAVSATMSKEEWQDKDTRISRQGVIQAAVQALAPLHGGEKLYAEAEKLADKMLEYVRRKA